MSLEVMQPSAPQAGETVVLMITGLTGEPRDDGISVEVDGLPAKVDIRYESRQAKLTISIPTAKTNRRIRYAVSDPNGSDVTSGRLTLTL